MKNFIVYNDSGDILRTGACADADITLQASDGEYVIEGECNDDINHKVINGALTYQKRETTNQEALQELKATRDQLLKASDWTQLSDNNLSQEKREQFQRYRQALRDLPQKYANITNIEQVEIPTLEQF